MNLDQTKLYNEEIRALQQKGYTLEVKEDRVFNHLEEAVIATKILRGGKVTITGCFAPAHFFIITIPSVEGRLHTLKTGSGSLDDYLDNLEAAIELISESMLVIESESLKQH